MMMMMMMMMELWAAVSDGDEANLSSVYGRAAERRSVDTRRIMT